MAAAIFFLNSSSLANSEVKLALCSTSSDELDMYPSLIYIVLCFLNELGVYGSIGLSRFLSRSDSSRDIIERCTILRFDRSPLWSSLLGDDDILESLE